MLTLEKVIELENEYFRRNGILTESDCSINSIQRAKIMAYQRKYKECFILSLNDNPVVIKYQSGLVRNFTGNYICKEVPADFRSFVNKWKRSIPNQDSIKRLDNITKDCLALHWV